MARMCLCLTAKTIKRNLQILEKYRRLADVAELRVDCLEPDERFLIRAFPEQTDIPVILSIRRTVDGGYFAGGEGARINLLAKGLAFANADRRRNFAYVDIEDDLDVPSLEEAARTFGTRIIRAYHNTRGVDSNLSRKIRGMKRNADDLVKVMMTTESTADVLRVLQAGRECSGVEKIIICAGRYGVCGRILAERFGSFLSYASAPEEDEIPKGAEHQIDIEELAKLYRFKNIDAATKVYGEFARPHENTDSPRFFNTVFALEDIDAVYVPFPVDSAGVGIKLADELDISGLSAAGSCRQEVVPFLTGQSADAQALGACDTLLRYNNGWNGINTGTGAFSASLLQFLGRENLKRAKITIIGSEGISRGMALEIFRLGASPLILGHTSREARALAAPRKFAAGGFDSEGHKLMEKYRDIIILSGGAADSARDKFLETYDFSGREALADMGREPEKNAFTARAEKAGCRVLTCSDTLTRRARNQYEQFFGREFPPRCNAKVLFGSGSDE